jgi:hypothetical protein
MKWLDLRAGTTYSEPPATFIAAHGLDTPQPENPYEIYAVEAAKKGIVDNKGVDLYLRGSK